MAHPNRHDAPDGAHQPGPRARRLLRWLAQGHTLEEAAQRIQRPLAQVEQRLADLLERLGADTPAEALAKLESGTAGHAAEAEAEAALAEPVNPPEADRDGPPASQAA